MIIATGAPRDAPLDVPGVELPGSFGGAEFVGWYNDHPDSSPQWPLNAESVAVIGGGNVALDVTRMLLAEAQSLQATDVSDQVREGIAGSRVREVHIFVRRGPADARFSPNELRALGELPGVDVVVDSVDVVPDRHVERMTKQLAHTRLTVETLRGFADAASADRTSRRRVHLHFYRQPAQILAAGKSKHSASSGQTRTDMVTSPLRVSVPTIRFKLCTGQSDFSGRHLPGCLSITDAAMLRTRAAQRSTRAVYRSRACS